MSHKTLALAFCLVFLGLPCAAQPFIGGIQIDKNEGEQGVVLSIFGGPMNEGLTPSALQIWDRISEPGEPQNPVNLPMSLTAANIKSGASLLLILNEDSTLMARHSKNSSVLGLNQDQATIAHSPTSHSLSWDAGGSVGTATRPLDAVYLRDTVTGEPVEVTVAGGVLQVTAPARRPAAEDYERCRVKRPIVEGIAPQIECDKK